MAHYLNHLFMERISLSNIHPHHSTLAKLDIYSIWWIPENFFNSFALYVLALSERSNLGAPLLDIKCFKVLLINQVLICTIVQRYNDMYNFFIFCPHLMNTGPQKLILLHLNGLSWLNLISRSADVCGKVYKKLSSFSHSKQSFTNFSQSVYIHNSYLTSQLATSLHNIVAICLLL